MPYRRNDMVGRVLSGLLVLVVLMLPVGRADALTLPLLGSASEAVLAGHGDEHPGLTPWPVRDSAGSPCDDCEHPDGDACCLSFGSVVGDLPSIHSVLRPLSAAPLNYLIISVTTPAGRNSAPDLPPPRHIV